MSADRYRNTGVGIGFVLILFMLAALAYSWLMPPWEAPDEPAHYVLVANLVRVNRFSTIDVNYEGHQPQPYYRLAAIPLNLLYQADPAYIEAYRPEADYDNLRSAAPVFDWNSENYRFIPGLYMLRWLNILVGAAAVAVMHAGLKRFFPDRPTDALSAIVFLAFIPQFLHTISTVSNDALGILAGAVLFYLLSRVITGETGLLELVTAMFAAVLLPPATKLTAASMGAVTLAAGIWQVLRRRHISWRVIAVAAAAVVLVVLLGLVLFPDAADILQEVILGRLFLVYEGAFTWESIRMMQAQLAGTFWGRVGWIGAGLPGMVVLSLSVLGAFGIWFSFWDALRPATRSPLLAWGLAAALAGLLVVFRNGFYTIANQGRLLFPSLAAVAFCVIAGWAPRLPETWRARLPWLIGLGWGVINLWLIFDKVLPVYYQPFE